MTIEWNKVTWYSKVLSVIVFLATFGIAFWLGVQWGQAQIAAPPAPVARSGVKSGGTASSSTETSPLVAGAGAHCGGFIKNAPVCAAGFHCQLSNIPDAGGVCVSGVTASSSLPSWTNGMTIITERDQGSTILLSEKERFAIMLGDSLDWTISFNPANDIVRVPSSINTGGFQGVYEADHPGTVTLEAEGRPICKTGEMCAQFIRLVKVTFVVS